MQLLQILYIAVSTLSICAGVPQLRKLIATKQSDELSVSSWLIWATAQFVSMLYAISINDLAYSIVCAVWFGFYVVMVVLIVKYRTKRPVEVTVDINDDKS